MTIRNQPPCPFDIVGFDLDGTLVDTSGDLTAAVNHALGLAGRAPLATDAIKPMIGLGAKHMLEQGLAATGGIDPADFKPLYRGLLSFYEANIAVHSRLFPGGADLLDALDARGVRYAVVTNKFESLAVKLLGELGVLDRMACVLGADTLGIENAKPSGAPVIEMMRRAGRTRAAFIGDSIYDMMAAANAGVTSVAVRFGFLYQPVETLGADHIIDHFDDLVPLLSAITPKTPS
jgi:phosphoglycolate phosphatase